MIRTRLCRKRKFNPFPAALHYVTASKTFFLWLLLALWAQLLLGHGPDHPLVFSLENKSTASNPHVAQFLFGPKTRKVSYTARL